MIGILRFIGIANAAVWFGSLIFFTVVVGPAFFSEGMINLFGAGNPQVGRAYASAAARSSSNATSGFTRSAAPSRWCIC
jgi:hypothetical protein